MYIGHVGIDKVPSKLSSLTMGIVTTTLISSRTCACACVASVFCPGNYMRSTWAIQTISGSNLVSSFS